MSYNIRLQAAIILSTTTVILWLSGCLGYRMSTVRFPEISLKYVEP